MKLQLLGAMDMKLSLNRVFYIPSGRVAALNLALAVVLICFAFLLHYLCLNSVDRERACISAKLLSGSQVCRRMCRTLRADARQYGLFHYFDKVLPCGLGCGQVLDFTW